jgi:hypothetical protein
MELAENKPSDATRSLNTGFAVLVILLMEIVLWSADVIQ